MSKNYKITIGILTILTLLFITLLVLRKKPLEKIKYNDFTEIKKNGRLRVLTEKSAVGFDFTGKDVKGFQYEIVKAFANSMGLELEISVITDLDSAINGLREHKYDIIAMNIPETKTIKEEINLTVPLISSRQMLVQRSMKDSLKNHFIKETSDLRQQKIYIPKNSPFKMRLKNLSDELADTIEIQEITGTTTEDLVKSISEGKILYTVCDELQARKLQKEYPNIDFSVPVGFNQQYCWAVDKKSMELLEKLNVFLTDFLTTNDYWNIYRKYYGVD